MVVEEAQGPGIDQAIKNRLLRWGIRSFTDIQAKALAAGVLEGRSLVICAPTSAGKSLIGEIAIFAALRRGVRAVYLVSHKALANQKYLDFVAKFSEGPSGEAQSIALNTGDRTEGDLDATILVATYEKALGLMLTGQLKPLDSLIVADEFQIVGDPGRGPDIETLCSMLRQCGAGQFIALTATAENCEDLAGWMNCSLVRSDHRDVPLHQEIWFKGKVYRTTFGQDEGRVVDLGFVPASDPLVVISQLLEIGRGPVLVFTETRREAMDLAAEFRKRRPRVGEGIELAEQLDLFSEPTESSEVLRESAERRIAFHTADLSSQERQVLEDGFAQSKFDVCFATSTLAAGVNFPFRTIVFPKLQYQYGNRAGYYFSRADYRNMSGRAGRLGLHDEGFAILLPMNDAELSHANYLVSAENDRVESQLIRLSVRKSVLALVTARLASSVEEVVGFFRNSLYWYQTLERNPEKLYTLQLSCEKAVEWLVTNGLLTNTSGFLQVTHLGACTAASGLLPGTVVQLTDLLRKHVQRFEDSFEEWVPGLIYAVCSTEEFRGDQPSRLLPWPNAKSFDSLTFWTQKKVPVPIDMADVKLAQCAHAVSLYAEGLADRKITHLTKLSSGAVQRLALDVAWVLEGLHRLASLPDLECSQTLGNQFALLARRVRWGAPPEALDVIRVAAQQNVPGFGRQRAMALVANGLRTIHDVLAASKDKLVELLRSEERAQALMDALSRSTGLSESRLHYVQSSIARQIGLEDLVRRAQETVGVDYERAITELLRVETAWSVTVLDDGVRQNVPDLLIKLGHLEVLLECKTSTRSPGLIKKEEAWAVLQKAADYSPSMRRVTLGKPAFDETCKKKVASSSDIVLVEHSAFIEGLLRVLTGTLSAEEFLSWLMKPGLAEIDRLGGKPTYL